MPKVSVIVPCWGVEKYLDRCVDSLVNQTLKDIEIILVDDVSPDRVPQMCDDWSQKDSRIKVVHKTVNGGLGLACNSGLEIATGEYVAFCDSDDWVDLEMYQTMFDAAVFYNADAVFTGLKRVNQEGNPCGELPHRDKLEVYTKKEELNEFSLDMICSNPSCRLERSIQMSAKVVLYKKKIIDDNSLRFVSEREVPSEDLHFNLNFINKSSCVCVLPFKFYNYMVNNSSITSVKKNLFLISTLKRYTYTLEECLSLGISGDFRTRCCRMLIGDSRGLIISIIRSTMNESEKKEEVSKISRNIIWKEIRKEYPIHKMPFVHMAFFICQNINSYLLMRVFSLLK